ncbi:hypothetical protein MD484_g6067, partial [Candolleomyces efflorescens]
MPACSARNIANEGGNDKDDLGIDKDSPRSTETCRSLSHEQHESSTPVPVALGRVDVYATGTVGNLQLGGAGGAKGEEEVKSLLKDIEKRKGLVGGVGYTYNPCIPLELELELAVKDRAWSWRQIPAIEKGEGPELWVPGKEDAVRVTFKPIADTNVNIHTTLEDDSQVIQDA